MKFLVYSVAVYCLLQGSQAAFPLSAGLDRSLVQTVLNFVAKELTVVNDFAQKVDQEKFKDPEQNRNNTVDLYVKIATTAFDLAANLSEKLVNVTGGGAQELVSCVHAEKAQARERVATNVESWGSCVTKQVPNLSIGFKDQLVALDSITSSVVDARADLESCNEGDIICIAESVSAIANGVSSSVTILVKGTQEVVAAYKIMFGTDVPACTEDTKPLVVEDISNLLGRIAQCLKL